MKLLKKLIKISIYSVIVLTIAKMSFEIWRIPDYRGGEADFVYSKDGKYKGMISANKIGTKKIAMLIRVKDNEVLAYEHLSRDGEIHRALSWFSCYGFNNITEPCFSPASFMEPVMIPPSLWHRVHAWLTVKIRGFENPNLREVDITPNLKLTEDDMKKFYEEYLKNKNLK